MEERDKGYRIVVGVGFTEACKHAMREALELGTRLPGAELHVTTALAHEHLDRPNALSRGYTDLLDTELRLVNFVRDVAKDARVLPATLAFVFHVRIGDVVATLNQVAFDVDARFVVVGSAPSGLAKLLHATVSERLIREGRYAILVARAPNVEGLVKTPKLDVRRPGEELTSPREGMLQSSERVDFALPHVHVAGLL